MNLENILKLAAAGFTKEDIMKLAAVPEEKEEPVREEPVQPKETAVNVPDMSELLEPIKSSIMDLQKQIQASNLIRDTAPDKKPEDVVDILATILNPPTKGK